MVAIVAVFVVCGSSVVSACGGTTGVPRSEGPVVISATSGRIEAVDVAVDPQGDAVAIWSASKRRDPYGSRVVYAAIRLRDRARWQPPYRVSAIGHDASESSVEMSATGQAVAVWHELRSRGKDLESSSIWTSTLDIAAGSWTAPTLLGSWPSLAPRPTDLQLGMDQAGTATAIWEEWEERRFVAATRETSTGIWSKPEPISTIPIFAETPLLAVGERGDAAVMYSRVCIPDVPACHTGNPNAIGEDLPRVLEVTVRGVGETWQGPQRLDAGRGSNGLYPVLRDLAIDGAGVVTAIWTKGWEDSSGLIASTRRADGWSSRQRLSPPRFHFDLGTPMGGDAALAVDRGGDAVVAWAGWREGPKYDVVVARSIRERGRQHWGIPTIVADLGEAGLFGGPAPDPSVGVDVAASGAVAMIWDSSASPVQFGALTGGTWERPRSAPQPRGELNILLVALSDVGATVLRTVTVAGGEQIEALWLRP
jgi:hypothetical protein